MATAWAAIADKTLHARAAQIPDAWRLAQTVADTKQPDVTRIPATCGILTAIELEITSKDATAVLAKIHAGEWTAEQVCIAFCKRAAIAQQLVNCLTEMRFLEAIEASRGLDKILQSTGEVVGPLHGLPISVKDHVNVAGLPSTLGYCAWANNVPAEDAVLVAALKAAGAIVIAKATMPVTGMALETVSQLYGRTLNPFNRALGSGGSSGGDGALVGMYGAPVGIGTDVAGSIRVPCAFNSLYGIRPSMKRLSYRGITSNVRGARGIIGTIGPMCHSLRDVELICRVATDAEPWLEDPNAIRKPWRRDLPPLPERLTIGVMKFDGVVMPHPPIQRALDYAVKKLKAAGHEVVEFAPYEHKRGWEIAYPLYYATGCNEMQALLDRTGEPWPPAAKKLSANPALRELSATELYRLHAAQDDYKIEYLRHWNGTAHRGVSGKPIQALLCPVNPCAGYPHDHLTWWGYSAQWSLLDYPAVSIPVGFVDKDKDLCDPVYSPIGEEDRENHALYDPELWHGAPIALQLVGRTLDEEGLLAVSTVVDQVVNIAKPVET